MLQEQPSTPAGKIQPWIGMKPKPKGRGVETVRHEFKEGQMLLDFSARGCAIPPQRP